MPIAYEKNRDNYSVFHFYPLLERGTRRQAGDLDWRQRYTLEITQFSLDYVFYYE